MSGWASLSGYLFIKPGGGGLNILKSKKRLWCVLEESQGKLLYFKSEEDARNKAPLGYIELQEAAITLDMDAPNQFVIIVDTREILLTAENHESMMIWMMALQARRDQFALADKTSHEDESDLDPSFDPDPNADWFVDGGGSRERSMSELSVFAQLQQRQNKLQQQQQQHAFLHKPLEGTKSFGLQGTKPSVSYLGQSPNWRRNQLKKMGETTDGCHPSLKTVFEKDRSRSLPPLLEDTTLTLLQPGSKQQSVSMEMSEVLHYLSPPPKLGQNVRDSNNISPLSQQVAHQVNGGGCLLNWSSSTSTSTDNISDEVAPSSLEVPHAHKLLGRSSSAMEGSIFLSPPPNEAARVNGSSTSAGDRVSSLEQELISTKCELAKVMNRQTCFQEILKQKDEIIEDLDEKLGSKVAGGDGYDSKKRATSNGSKGNQERVRVLQNQNRFLNEEVRRLAKLRQHEQLRIQSQDGQVRSLEADIEVWKLEYISLIQSSIRFTGTDTMDDAELSLFGGDRHKHRILSLLDDARKINPSLPTYEYLSTGEVHVDCFGFKHQFTDDGLLLHYLCQELSQHFLSQASSYENHQKQWSLYLKHNAKNVLSDRKELKKLVRGGIPEPFRKLMWKSFVMAKVDDIIQDKGVHYYRQLCNAVPDSPLAARYRKQISLDLMRTMPSNVKFSSAGSRGIMDLQDVLLAFCIHNPNVGYCQGMNFLVAMALLFMDAQDAFWTLVAVTECYHSPSYFDHNLLGAQADQSVLHDLMDEKMPDLARHLDAIEIEISTVTLNWFLALFFDAVPFQTLLRVWDCFLFEGPKVLFRFSLGILHSHSKEILRKTDTISVMRHLKACARISYDTDGLVQAAFKTLKPFPRRQDIVSKQTFYLNGLKEKYMWREMQKAAISDRDGLLGGGEPETEVQEGVFECCAITAAGQAWVAYGCPTGTKVCVVDCMGQVMTDTSIQLDSRVLCMSSAEDECVFMGTLSSVVYAWNQKNRSVAWHQRVHDAVLSLQVFKECEGDSPHRLFAALADGTVAVFETVSLSCKVNDLLYLPIGQSPVSCLQLLGNQLWCASGNTVSIIHASTLDPMDQFNVSSNPYDTILSMVPGIPGVWISVRGSSVLELWDPATLSCKMLYDTCNGKCPNLRKEDDTYFNSARITSILALDHSVWVGTGEGTLYTFDVFGHQGIASQSSSYITDSIMGMDGEHSLKPLVDKDQDPQQSESYARIVEVEKRVKDMYLQRLIRDGLAEKRKRKNDENDEDDGDDDEEDNDTETEERRCLILEKEEREMLRMKKKGKEDDKSKSDVLKGKRRVIMREKLNSADSVLGKSKNSKSVQDSKHKNESLDKTIDDKADKMSQQGNNSGTASQISNSNRRAVLRKSLSLDLSDNKEQVENVVPVKLVEKINSRNSSTSSVHVLEKTIKEEEAGDEEEELLNDKIDVKSNSNDKSSPKKPAPDYPTVYYLFRPEIDEEGRSSSSNTVTNNSDETLNKSRESQPQMRTKKPSSPASPRDVTKSEDSGISCSTEKNTDGNEISDGILTADEIAVTENGSVLEEEQQQQVVEDRKDAERVGELQTGKSGNLECCVNVSSQFYNGQEKSCDGSDFSQQDKTKHSSLKAVNSLESNGRSNSEESNKTTGSDDVFSDVVDDDVLPAQVQEPLDNGIEDDTGLHFSKSPKKVPLSKLSSQLEMDDKLETTKEKVVPHPSENSLPENKTEEEADVTVNHNDNANNEHENNNLTVNGDEDTSSSFKSSKSIEIARTPQSINNHCRKRIDTIVSSPNNHLANGGENYSDKDIEKMFYETVSHSLVNGINHDASSGSEEEDSFGDFVGETKPIEDSETNKDMIIDVFTNDSKKLDSSFPATVNHKIIEDFSDQQSESAYSTSSDSFQSDPESDLVESFSSLSKVKTLAAKFETVASEETSNKTPPSNGAVEPKCKTKPKHNISNSVVEKCKDVVVRNNHPGVSAPVRRTHLKLCRLSSSGQSEHLAHEVCSSASSSERSSEPTQKSTSHNHNAPNKINGRQILTTTSSGKMKLSKRSSSQRLLRASANIDKEGGETIDTKYYGDSDEDKRVHEARVKSFKDSYAVVSNRRLSTSNSQKAQLTKGDSSIPEVGKSRGELSNSQDPHSQSLSSTGTQNMAPKNNQNSKMPFVPSSQPVANNDVLPTDATSVVGRHNSIHSIGRLGSDVGSTNGNIQPRDAGARWRLDYTNVHVDTDMESLAFSFDGDSLISDPTDTTLQGRRLSGMSLSTECNDQRMNQFLRDTASSFEDHHRNALNEEKVSFLHTPTLSRSNSVCWSSYDEISTPSQCDADITVPGKSHEIRFPRSTTYSLASRSTSVASTVEVQFNVDMSLLSKNKISDKAVKWLLRTEMRGKPTVLSLAGAHTDDEAVLVWTREANETLWTNCPIFAYNPKTKTATLPRYMRSQMSSSSSSIGSPQLQRFPSVNSN